MPSTPRQRIKIKKSKNKLSEEQKAGFILILITGTLSLVLGILFFVRNINRPFDLNYEGPIFMTSADRRAREIELMKTRDTDGDGLTDYDEIFVYGTSPYLADTSGDGISDGEHVRAGNNPLTGSPIGEPIPATDSRDEFLASFDLNMNINSWEGIENMEALDGQGSGRVITDPWQLSAAEVRELLKSQGMTEEQLNQVSDQQLLQRYYALLEEYEAGLLDESGQPIQLEEESSENSQSIE